MRVVFKPASGSVKRLARPQFEHGRLGADRVAGEHRLGKAHVLPAEIADGGAERRIADRKPDHEAQGEDAVDQWLSEFGRLGVLVVDVKRGRIVGERREQDVVHVGDGAPHLVDETLADEEFLEIEPGHPVPPPSI
jgi:hypothetical protein